MRWIAMTVGLWALVGCASPPAPRMEQAKYLSFAESWVGLNRCIESGAIDPGTGALGKQYLQGALGGYTYDQGYLNQEVNRLSAMVSNVPQGKCNQVAAAILAEKNRLDTFNANVARSEQSLQNTINQINQSRPVYCNTVGGVTMCN